jgi:hypothetical protein
MQYKTLFGKQWKYSQTKSCLFVFNAKSDPKDINGKHSFGKSVSTEHKVVSAPETVTEKQLIMFDLGDGCIALVDSFCEIKGTVRVMDERSGMFEVIK